MVALPKPDNRILDTIIQGDCLEVLRAMPACSVDAIVTDPPAGISFMGKDWDNPDYFPLRDRGERLTGSGNPTGGIMLDCFAGSGSTLVACVQVLLHFIGIEAEADYCAIARARLAYVM